MTESLRDRLAAVLGPGNDDATAYAQADAVLDIIADHTPTAVSMYIHKRMRDRILERWPDDTFEEELAVTERWSATL